MDLYLRRVYLVLIKLYYCCLRYEYGFSLANVHVGDNLSFDRSQPPPRWYLFVVASVRQGSHQINNQAAYTRAIPQLYI